MRADVDATECHFMSVSATFCLKTLGVACPAFNTLISDVRSFARSHFHYAVIMLKLTELQKTKLRPLEAELQRCVQSGESEKAVEIVGQIQNIFGSERRHHRLLRDKLWAYESALDANSLVYAESGFTGVRSLSGKGTRLYLEATILLSICALRQKKLTEAKRLIRQVVENLNNITSDRKRRQFQRRFIERVEEECILSELIGRTDGPLDPKDIEEKAIMLIKHSHQDQILALIGQSLPPASVLTLSEVRNYSILMLPPADRKFLPAPENALESQKIGKRTFDLIHRIGWKTFCAPDSTIFQLWSKKTPEVFSKGYFTSATIAALNQWRIGIPMIAAGMAAIIMKYSAEQFCEITRPKGLMVGKGDMED